MPRSSMIDMVGFAERVALALSTVGLTPPPVPQPFYEAYLASMGARALIAATRVEQSVEVRA